MKRALSAKRSLQSSLLIVGLVGLIPTPASAQSLTAFYRWFYAGDNDNFYTISSSSPGRYVFSSQLVGTVPFFRWYSTISGRHYYTTDSRFGGTGWVYEGIEGYVSPPG